MNVIDVRAANKVADGENILLTRQIHPWSTESRRVPLHNVVVRLLGTATMFRADEGTYIIPSNEIVEVFE